MSDAHGAELSAAEQVAAVCHAMAVGSLSGAPRWKELGFRATYHGTRRARPALVLLARATGEDVCLAQRALCCYTCTVSRFSMHTYITVANSCTVLVGDAQYWESRVCIVLHFTLALALALALKCRHWSLARL